MVKWDFGGSGNGTTLDKEVVCWQVPKVTQGELKINEVKEDKKQRLISQMGLWFGY